jgi:hypothetical protein
MTTTVNNAIPEAQRGPADRLLELVLRSGGHLWHNRPGLDDGGVWRPATQRRRAVNAAAPRLGAGLFVPAAVELHVAMAGDGRFGLVRWDERFVADGEDRAGQATCEGGEHLPFIGLLAAALARSLQDFIVDGVRRDAVVSLSAVSTF